MDKLWLCLETASNIASSYKHYKQCGVVEARKEGEDKMTVGEKVHQALASLRTLEGEFETFALDTQDKQAQQLYNQCRQQIQQMVQQLEPRVNYMEQQEPSYKISNNQQQGGTSMGTTGGTNMGTTNTNTNTRPRR